MHAARRMIGEWNAVFIMGTGAQQDRRIGEAPAAPSTVGHSWPRGKPQRSTSIAFTARMTPPSGPESNSAMMLSFPGVCDWGTRTEAGQKVPQAKPECAVASTCSVLAPWSETRAPRISCIDGEVGAPR